MGTLLPIAGAAGARPDARAAAPDLAQQVRQLGRTTGWTPAGAIPVKFRTFHPQGMVRIGDVFFVTSVEVLEAPKRLAAPRDGFDRDQGRGRGWLFKIGPDGALLAQTELGEGAIYHPGGLDYDGAALWVPVAEYRPGGRSIVYRVDPASLKSQEVFRFRDHLGALVHDREGGRLVGMNWGSRAYYAWRLSGGRVRDARAKPTPNGAGYIDYQDCQSLGARQMLCTGLADYPAGRPGERFSLGGAELVDLRDFRPVHQAPIALWTPGGRAMTQNAVAFEAAPTGLRAWFMPEDEASTLYVYDAIPRLLP